MASTQTLYWNSIWTVFIFSVLHENILSFIFLKCQLSLEVFQGRDLHPSYRVSFTLRSLRFKSKIGWFEGRVCILTTDSHSCTCPTQRILIKSLDYVIDAVDEEKLEIYPGAINTTCCRKDRIHGPQVIMPCCHLKIYHLDFHFAQGSKLPSKIQPHLCLQRAMLDMDRHYLQLKSQGVLWT